MLIAAPVHAAAVVELFVDSGPHSTKRNSQNTPALVFADHITAWAMADQNGVSTRFVPGIDTCLGSSFGYPVIGNCGIEVSHPASFAEAEVYAPEGRLRAGALAADPGEARALAGIIDYSPVFTGQPVTFTIHVDGDLSRPLGGRASLTARVWFDEVFRGQEFQDLVLIDETVVLDSGLPFQSSTTIDDPFLLALLNLSTSMTFELTARAEDGGRADAIGTAYLQIVGGFQSSQGYSYPGPAASAVPEPGTVALLSGGIAALWLKRRLKR